MNTFKFYTPTEHGLVSNDGWVESLDFPRDEEESDIVNLPRCVVCGNPYFNLLHILSITNFCNCGES